MPVFKYRTHEEAHRARWLAPGDPRLPRLIVSLMGMADFLCPVERPPGVRKFRTIEEARAWRDGWKQHPWKRTSERGVGGTPEDGAPDGP